MMNRIYLLFVLSFLFVGNAIAQKTIDLEALPELIGKTATTKQPITNGYKLLYDGDGNSKYWFTWRAKNNGPDALSAGDSLFFRTGYGQRIVYVYSPTSNPTEKDSSIGIIPVAQGTSNETFVTLEPNNTITESKTETGIQWCDSVWAKSPSPATITDPVATNNRSCHTVDITFWLTGINTVANYADGFIMYPNPTTEGKLNIQYEFKSAKNVSLVVRDLVGKVVYNKAFGDISGSFNHTMDVSALPAGMYLTEMNFNNEKLVSRVTIK